MRGFLVMAIVMAVGAPEAAGQIQAGGIRDVVATERSVIPLSLKIRYATQLNLPEGEFIVSVACGDQESWQVNFKAESGVAYIKPAKEGSETNLHVLGSSGRTYSFLLREAKAAPDVKVYVRVDSLASDVSAVAAAAGGVKAAPKYFTASHVEALEAELQGATAKAEAVQRVADQSLAKAKAAYPIAMRFDYRPILYARPFFIRSMWHDDQFTYIKTDALEVPTLYELKDGKASMINFEMPQPDTYVVPKILEDGYFTLGKQRLEFRRKE